MNSGQSTGERPASSVPAAAGERAGFPGLPQRFQIRECLGEGSQKRVYRAHDAMLEREVAIAVLPLAAMSEADRAGVRREAKLMAKVGERPHLVPIFDTIEHPDVLYLVSRFMRGGTLAEELAREGAAGLPIARVVVIARDVCAGLQHAHDAGVTHRDVKPANVFLDDRGTAHLGDFGLSLDSRRGRLTEDEMLVGTPPYMAPEVLDGRLGDARSDLYALGCVLYEMLTGRPPFAGAELRDRLLQLVRAAPVPPRRRRADVPPALEDLVLSLLAESPEQRPQSASATLAALDGIGASGGARAAGRRHVAPARRRRPLPPPVTGTDGAAVAGRALPGALLVGREEPLAWIQARLGDACAGAPRVALIGGEVGIGKTRLLAELRAVALNRGVTVGWGRSFEEGTPPYLPIVEAVRQALDLSTPNSIAVEGRNRSILRRFLEEGGVSSRRPPSVGAVVDADRERLRLFLTVSRAVIEATKEKPLLLVLDDLHWADRSSLDLFLHLAFATADHGAREAVRLLIVGAFRPVQPSDQLATVLLRLLRESFCERFDLTGLGEIDVQALIRALTQAEPAPRLVESLVAATRGNPLFVREIVQGWMAAGALRERDGLLTLADPAAPLHLPGEIASVVAARTEALSVPCRRVLARAAFLGDPFDLKTLATVVAVAPRTVRTRLDEGIAQGMVEPEGDDFRFTHPLVRHAFYTLPSATERRLIHAGIATALETRADEVNLLRLARQFVAAENEVDPAKVALYAGRAGVQAARLFAWGEAAAFYEAAIAAAERIDGFDQRMFAGLLHGAAFAHLRGRDMGPCLARYRAAVAAYEAVGEVRSLALALKEQADAMLTMRGPNVDIEPLQNVLDRLGPDADDVAGRLLTTIAQVQWVTNRLAEAESTAERAVGISARTGDTVLAASAHVVRAIAQAQQLRVDDALASYEKALTITLRSGDLRLQNWPRQRIPMVLFWAGRLDDAMAAAREAESLVLQTHDWAEHSLGLGTQACIAVARGDMRTAGRCVEQTLAMIRRTRYPWGAPLCLPALAGAHVGRGAYADARRTLETLVSPGQVFDEPGGGIQLLARLYGDLVRAYTEPSPTIRAELATAMLTAIPWPEKADVNSLGPLCAAVEVADLAGVSELAARAYEPLLYAETQGVVFSSGWVFLLSRVLGVAAALLGDRARAEVHFRTAIAAAQRAGAGPELGRACFDLARLLAAARAETSIGDETRQLIDLALSAFGRGGLAPWTARAEAWAAAHGIEVVPLARASGVADQAQPWSGQAAAGIARTPERQVLAVLFTDLAGSTELIDRLGDVGARAVLRRHDHIVRRCLTKRGARQLKHTGDGFMAAFAAAADAVRCALDIQAELAKQNTADADARLLVRIGISAGEPVRDGSELFGAAVNAAARICGRARPGQVLVADVVRQLIADPAFSFVDRGRVSLRGFRERVHVFEVQRKPPLTRPRRARKGEGNAHQR
ncbi:protein kinase [Candidatus Binatia bacterium]|nr:protein kinase [Candidatus Binatia bacterium]